MRIINAIRAQKIGGVDRVFRDYNEILSTQGHEVAALISDNGDDNYNFKKIFKLKNFNQILDCLHLLCIFYKFKPDVVICHSTRLMKWMRILRYFYRFKSIGVNHGTTFKHSMNCDYAISVNKQIADNLINAGFDKNKSFIVSNAVRIDRRYQEKIIKPTPVIGIYGRIEMTKGFDILIKAAEILAKKNYDFRLKIGGFEVENSGYYFKDIEDLARKCDIFEKITFVGTVFDKEKFFKDVDILCVPSREESFGLPILEAFLFSTLVVSSDSDGGKFLIKNGENGILFARQNYQELAEKLIEIFTNPHITANITRNAFLKLEKEFSFDILSKELSIILEKVKQG